MKKSHFNNVNLKWAEQQVQYALGINSLYALLASQINHAVDVLC